jgi:hypothetical protein
VISDETRGSWFWFVSLAASALIPLSAVVWLNLAGPVGLSTAAVLFLCGAAALLDRRGRSVSNLLLCAALVVMLVWIFLLAGHDPLMLYAVIVLGGAGVGVRAATAKREARVS